VTNARLCGVLELEGSEGEGLERDIWQIRGVENRGGIEEKERLLRVWQIE
jgi:hypothetical protein